MPEKNSASNYSGRPKSAYSSNLSAHSLIPSRGPEGVDSRAIICGDLRAKARAAMDIGMTVNTSSTFFQLLKSVGKRKAPGLLEGSNRDS